MPGWITADEEPGVQFQHSTDGINFANLVIDSGQLTLNVPAIPAGAYLLLVR